MAIEVRIPTILRTYTGGAKSVEGSGDTLAGLLADLDSRHGGLAERLVDDSGLRRVDRTERRHLEHQLATCAMLDDEQLEACGLAPDLACELAQMNDAFSGFEEIARTVSRFA